MSLNSNPSRRRSPTPPPYGQDRGALPPRNHRARADYTDSYRPPVKDPRTHVRRGSPDLIRRAEPARTLPREYYSASNLVRGTSAQSERERSDRERNAREYKTSFNNRAQQTSRISRAASYGDHAHGRSSSFQETRRSYDGLPLDVAADRRVSAPVTIDRPASKQPITHTADSSDFIHPERRKSLPTFDGTGDSEATRGLAPVETTTKDQLLSEVDQETSSSVQGQQQTSKPSEDTSQDAAPAETENLRESRDSEDYINPFDLMDDASSIDDSKPSTGIISNVSPSKEPRDPLDDHNDEDGDDLATKVPHISELRSEYLSSGPEQKEYHTDLVVEDPDAHGSPKAMSEASTVHLEDPESHALALDRTEPKIVYGDNDDNDDNGDKRHSDASSVAKEDLTTSLSPSIDVSEAVNLGSSPIHNDQGIEESHEEIMSIKSDMDDLRSSTSSRRSSLDAPSEHKSLEVLDNIRKYEPLKDSQAPVIQPYVEEHVEHLSSASSEKATEAPELEEQTVLTANEPIDAPITDQISTSSNIATADAKSPAELRDQYPTALPLQTTIKGVLPESSAESQHTEALDVPQPGQAQGLRSATPELVADDKTVDTNHLEDCEALVGVSEPATAPAIAAETQSDPKRPQDVLNHEPSAIVANISNDLQRTDEDREAQDSTSFTKAAVETAEISGTKQDEINDESEAERRVLTPEDFEAMEQGGEDMVASKSQQRKQQRQQIISDIKDLNRQAEKVKQRMASLSVQRSVLSVEKQAEHEELRKVAEMRTALSSQIFLSTTRYCHPFDDSLSKRVTAEAKSTNRDHTRLIRRRIFKEPQEHAFFKENLNFFTSKKADIVAYLSSMKIALLDEEEELRSEYEQRQRKWMKNAIRCDRQRLQEIEQEEAEAALAATVAAPTRGTRNKPVGYEIKEALSGVETPNNVLNEAVIPAMIRDPFERELYTYADLNHVVFKPLEYYNITIDDPREVWTEEEQAIFSARYKLTPKQFGSIAAGLPGRTAKECVLHYYKTKKMLDYRAAGKPKTKTSGRGRGRAKKVVVGRTARRAAMATVTVLEGEEDDNVEDETEVKSLRKRRAINDIDETQRKVRSLRKPTKKSIEMPIVQTQPSPPPRDILDLQYTAGPTLMLPSPLPSLDVQSQKQSLPRPREGPPPSFSRRQQEREPQPKQYRHNQFPNEEPQQQLTPQEQRERQQQLDHRGLHAGPQQYQKSKENQPINFSHIQRPQHQVFQRAPMAAHPFGDSRHYTWTDQDEALFVDLLKRFGTDYSAIASHMHMKTTDQVQKHFDEFLIERHYRQYLPRSGGLLNRPLNSNYGPQIPAQQTFNSRPPLLTAPQFPNQYQSFNQPSRSPTRHEPPAFNPLSRNPLPAPTQSQHGSYVSSHQPRTSQPSSFPQVHAGPSHQQFHFDYRQAPPPVRAPFDTRHDTSRGSVRGSIDSMLNSGERVLLPPISGSRAPSQGPSDGRYTPYFTPPPSSHYQPAAPVQQQAPSYNQQQPQQQQQDSRYSQYSTPNYGRNQQPWR